MTMGSDTLVDEISLVLSRACIELARAQLRQREKNTPTHRAAVARCAPRGTPSCTATPTRAVAGN
jgi:hypothetical protein